MNIRVLINAMIDDLVVFYTSVGSFVFSLIFLPRITNSQIVIKPFKSRQTLKVRN